MLVYEYAIRTPEAKEYFGKVLSPQILVRGNKVDYAGKRYKVCTTGVRKHPDNKLQGQRTLTVKEINHV